MFLYRLIALCAVCVALFVTISPKWESPQMIVEIGKIQSQIQKNILQNQNKIQKTAPKHFSNKELNNTSSLNILELSQNYTQVTDLLALIETHLSKHNHNADTMNHLALAKEWLERILDDEVSSQNPLEQINNIYSLALMIDRGIQSYERATYRSSSFIKSYGYDIVKYTVRHLDNSESYLLSYRERRQDSVVAIGGPDTRPTYLLTLVAQQKTPEDPGFYLSLFENGKLMQNNTVNTTEALELLARQIHPATSLQLQKASR